MCRSTEEHRDEIDWKALNMARLESFEDQILQAICDVLGDTGTGLTGGEIARLLDDCGIEDPSPGMTKRFRLSEALSNRQRIDRCGNNVVAFIQAAMNPVRHVHDRESFEDRRSRLNEVISFAGLLLGDDGKLSRSAQVRTLSEAQERASRLRRQLEDRRVHPDVLRFCRSELIQDNYFHAVFEAT